MIRTPPLTSQAFHLPVLVMIWPETVEEMNRPPIIGMVMTPDIVGDLSRASWKYWLKKTVPVNIATPTKSEASEERVMVRLRNSRSGMIGSLGLGLDEHEQQPEHDRAADHRVRLPRHPVVLVTGEGDPDQQQRDRGGDEERAAPVDLHVPLHDGQVQGLLQHDQRDDRERHTDVEAPAPAEPARCR